jgi:excisionase family DNA binding protein
MASKLLTADQVAEQLNVCKGHVYELVRQGVIPKVPFLGRVVRIRQEAIDDLLRSPEDGRMRERINGAAPRERPAPDTGRVGSDASQE